VYRPKGRNAMGKKKENNRRTHKNNRGIKGGGVEYITGGKKSNTYPPNCGKSTTCKKQKSRKGLMQLTTENPVGH